MFQFPGFCFPALRPGFRRMNGGGLPHSEIPGSTPVCGSPRLIAAYHVLHRLLVPSHPPLALSRLTTEIILSALRIHENIRRPKATFVRCDLKKTLLQLSKSQEFGSPGDGRDRTGGLLLGKQALSQLSYVPWRRPQNESPQPGPLCVLGADSVPDLGARGIEPLTPALSRRCSTN